MKTLFKLKWRYIALTLACCLGLLSTQNVTSYAATNNNGTLSNTEYSDIEPIENVGISRAEAIEFFGLTEEEAKDMDFYSVTASAIESGELYDSGYFTFTGSNTGSYRTMNGNKLMYSIAWKPLSSDGGEVLEAYLYPYGATTYMDHAYISLATTETGGTNNEYRIWRSEWLDIQYGLDYHFVYESYIMWGNDTPCQIRVLIAVA